MFYSKFSTDSPARSKLDEEEDLIYSQNNSLI